MKGDLQMQSYKINNSKTNESNYFLGGYIISLNDYEDRSYISIGMKSSSKNGSEPVFIMIFRQCGYGNKKYDNPTIKIILDAFEKGLPIACVYNHNAQRNVMLCAYTNFSLNDAEQECNVSGATSPDEFIDISDEDLPF